MQLDTQAVNLHTPPLGGTTATPEGARGESLDSHTQVRVQDWLRSVMLWGREMRRLPSRTHLRTSCVDLSWQIDLPWFPNVILQTKGWNKNSSTSRWTLRISRSYGRVLCDSGMVCFDISLCWKCGHITGVTVVCYVTLEWSASTFLCAGSVDILQELRSCAMWLWNGLLRHFFVLEVWTYYRRRQALA